MPPGGGTTGKENPAVGRLCQAPTGHPQPSRRDGLQEILFSSQ